MIPRSDGPWRPIEETIAACEAHRDFLYLDYLQAIVDGREPTADETAENTRREHERRKVARMRAKSAARRRARRVLEEAHRIVIAEHRRWMGE